MRSLPTPSHRDRCTRRRTPLGCGKPGPAALTGPPPAARKTHGSGVLLRGARTARAPPILFGTILFLASSCCSSVGCSAPTSRFGRRRAPGHRRSWSWRHHWRRWPPRSSCSSVTYHAGLTGRPSRAHRWTAGVDPDHLALGAVFLGIQMYDYARLPFEVSTNAYGTMYYAMTGLHGLHVLAGLLMLVVLARTAQGAYRGPDRRHARRRLLAFRRRGVDRPVHDAVPGALSWPREPKPACSRGSCASGCSSRSWPRSDGRSGRRRRARRPIWKRGAERCMKRTARPAMASTRRERPTVPHRDRRSRRGRLHAAHRQDALANPAISRPAASRDSPGTRSAR